MDSPEQIIENIWSRPLRAWELQEVLKLNDIINFINFAAGKDSLIWIKSQSPYTAKLGNEFLGSSISSQFTGWIFRWKIKVPPKVFIFLWKFKHGVLPTKSLLYERIGDAIENPLCNWCNVKEEDQVHLFWDCELARKSWEALFNWWDIKVKVSSQSLSSIWFWQKWFLNSSVKASWNITMASCLWIIWICRNQLIFDKSKVNTCHLSYIIRMRSWNWITAASIISISSEDLWHVCSEQVVLMESKSYQVNLLKEDADFMVLLMELFKEILLRNVMQV